jgi:hypothetical protein
MHAMKRARWTAAVVGVAIAGCSQQPQASADGGTRSVGSVISRTPRDTATPVPRDTTPDARVKLVKLEQEARALARTSGCATVTACRTAPVGWRGCGGPRTYLVYCAATTDTTALFRKLKELENAERDYNASSGMMSTCEYRMPPGVRLEGRSCREAPAGP